MSAPARPSPRPRPAIPGPWAGLLGACLALVTGAETLLLGVGTGYLTSGYNTEHIGSWLLLLVFLASGAAMDLALILGLCALVVPVARRLRATPLQVFCAAGLAAAGLPVAVAAARYNLYSVLGDLVSVALLRESSQLSSSAMAAEIAQEGNAFAAALGAGLVASLLVLMAARRVELRHPALGPRLAAPRARALWSGFAVFTAIGAGLFALSSPLAAPLLFGFDRKTSGILISRAVERLTDVDRDGYGLLSRPPDPRLLDASIRPYRPEIPGNGIDENGVGGDLPVAADRIPPAREPVFAPGPRPHVLLVYLESFRADLIGQRLGSREITPFLNRLAAEGAASEHAYVHSPWTLASRAQLFGGRLVNRPGDATLIDDFKSRGYAVAHFSGQDDSYGDSESVLGTGRADAFYDARGDLDRRTSRSTAPVSLQVSWKTLVSRVEEHLAEVDPRRPLFLYVNVVDTHYPYFHAELDPLLDVEPLRRALIRASRARQVWEAYANAAANVDRALERLVLSFRRSLGDADHAILVTGDHGQSFYENGLLGHGQALDEAQTRVPFVLWGIGGRWPEPLAPSDVRALLAENLGRERGSGAPRARFVPDPERLVFQYLSDLERPRRVALRGIGARDEYDFERGRFRRLRAEGATLDLAPAERGLALERLIWRWEAEQRAALAAGEGGS